MVDSISKTTVTHAVAEEIVADAFGADVHLDEFVECTEGWFNAAYLMALDDGRRSVLKVAPPPGVTVLTYEHDIMATEVSAMRLLAEHTTVPVPRVLWSDTSCVRVPSSLFVMECCRGRLLSELRAGLSVEQQQGIDAQLAHVLRDVNAITHPSFGLLAPGAPSFGSWGDAFVHLVDILLHDGEVAAVPMPVPYDSLRELARTRRAALDEVTVPALVHWDLWDTNVFVDPQSLAVTGVIDFERALWADPLMEAQFLSKHGDEAFVAAYGIDLFAAPGASTRRLLYDLYLYLVMVIESTYRRYPTPDIEQYARRKLATTLAALAERRP